MSALYIILIVTLIPYGTGLNHLNITSNHTAIPNDDKSIQDIQLDINPNLNLMQKLWLSIGDTVSSDLKYLKSLATSQSCHEKIETEYLQNILYPVIHKDQPFSYNLTNLCPNPNSLRRNRPINGPNIKTTNPKSLRIVYLIIMYKNPSQVIRLISALNTSMDHFLIHIDAKSPINVSEPILNLAAIHSNIHIVLCISVKIHIAHNTQNRISISLLLLFRWSDRS